MSTEQSFLTVSGIDCSLALETPKHERYAQNRAAGDNIIEAAVSAGWRRCRSVHQTIRQLLGNHPEIELRIHFLLSHRGETAVCDIDAIVSDEAVVRGILRIAKSTDQQVDEEGVCTASAAERAVSLNAYAKLADIKSMLTRRADPVDKGNLPKKYDGASDADLLAAAAEYIEGLPPAERAKIVGMLDKTVVQVETAPAKLDS